MRSEQRNNHPLCEFEWTDKESGLRFFPAFTWAVAAAVNSRPEFRLGYDSAGRLGRFDTVTAELLYLGVTGEQLTSRVRAMEGGEAQ